MSEFSKSQLADLEQRYEKLVCSVGEAAKRSGRRREDITILGVSKFQGSEKIAYLQQKGLSHFGESYLQEALPKMDHLSSLPIQWHYIGRIQTKKIAKILEHFEWIESVDSLKLLAAINDKASALNTPPKVLLQVNIGRESSKAGFLPEQTQELSQSLNEFKNVRPSGLMCLPPLIDDEVQQRHHFVLMREIQAELKSKLAPQVRDSFTELSMGTSHDYALAIEEGATIIRVGTNLFGERPS